MRQGTKPDDDHQVALARSRDVDLRSVSRRALAAHGLANDGKSLLPDRLAGHDIIRTIEEA
jgi:hypothetical protein